MSPAASIQFRHIGFLDKSVSGSLATGTTLHPELMRVCHDSHFLQEPAPERLVLRVLTYQDILHSLLAGGGTPGEAAGGPCSRIRLRPAPRTCSRHGTPPAPPPRPVRRWKRSCPPHRGQGPHHSAAPTFRSPSPQASIQSARLWRLMGGDPADRTGMRSGSPPVSRSSSRPVRIAGTVSGAAAAVRPWPPASPRRSRAPTGPGPRGRRSRSRLQSVADRPILDHFHAPTFKTRHRHLLHAGWRPRSRCTPCPLIP